jgi:thiamine biosynthesis lipoprotein ApbE
MIALLMLLATGESYLTPEQALKLVFPSADRVHLRTVTLGPDVLAKVADKYGSSVAPAQDVYVGERGGAVCGYAMILTEVTKTLSARFIVGITPEGEVSEVAVLSHEDHIGVDCRRERFLQQFRGKTVNNRITVPNGGILPVSGATLSCQAVARAVRKTVAVVQHHFVEKPENARAALQAEQVQRKRYLMGTFCTITAEATAEVVEKAFDEIKRLEKVLSDYDEKSELSRLNREGSIKAGPELLRFLKESRTYHDRTSGAFDVTVAPLVLLWGFKDGKHRVPAEEEIRAALGKVGLARVAIAGDAVTLAPGTMLDPGGIGKGMAVDRALESLRRAGVKRALVDFGSSTAALGTWEVGIRDPFDGRQILGKVTLTDESLSTAGSYEKRFEANGTTYTHILDPRTGKPAQGVVSVSVIAPTATESDGLDTGFLVLRSLPAEATALMVLDDGTRKATDGWRKRFREGRE